MKLSELIARAGDENVTFQNLANDYTLIDTKAGEISFRTDKAKAEDLVRRLFHVRRPKYTALVVWIPNSKMPGPVKQEGGGLS